MDKENKEATPPQQLAGRRTPVKTYTPRRKRLMLDEHNEVVPIPAKVSSDEEPSEAASNIRKRKFECESPMTISWMSQDAANPFSSLLREDEYEDPDFLKKRKDAASATITSILTSPSPRRCTTSTPTTPIQKKPITNSFAVLMSPKKPSTPTATTKTPTPTKRRKVVETLKSERKTESKNEEKNAKGKEKETKGEANQPATTTGNNETPKKMRQMYLDFGQKHFDWKVCPQCEMMYTPGIPAEEAMHTRFHKKFVASTAPSSIF